MDDFLSKLLPLFVYPMGLVILLGVIASLLARIWSPPALQGLDLGLTGTTGLRPYIRPFNGAKVAIWP